MTMLRVVFVLVGVVSVASAQVVADVGPPVAPIGGQVIGSVSNDTSSTFYLGSIGPIRVLDGNGLEVWWLHALPIIPIPVPAGQAMVYFNWDQRDSAGNQLPPGPYVVEVWVNGAMTTHTVGIGGVDAALTPIGVLRPGVTRDVFLNSPLDPGGAFIMAAAFTNTVGQPSCAGTLPLDNDTLFALSTTPGGGIFSNTTGVLNGPNTWLPSSSTAPSITVPNIPALSGLTANLAFVIVDPTQGCPIIRISAPTLVTVL